MDVRLKLFVALVLAYSVHHSIKVINVTGLFVHRYNHQPGPCRLIPGIEYGSEDIQALSNGKALISAGWGKLNPSDELVGMYSFDFNQPNKNVSKLTLTGKLPEKGFMPHGFSLWTDSDTGIVTVFIINHGPTMFNNESVEVFRFDETTKSLHHLKTIKDVNFRRLNDIVATGSDTFYATNDCRWFQSQLRWTLEIYLQTHFGNVVYYDGESARPVASGYVLPIGINVSPDKRLVYVILSGESQLVVFQRHTDGSLSEIKRVVLHMSRPDNIDIGKTGDLWIAGSYKLFSETQLLSSMILHGKESDGEYSFSEVYVNDGTGIDFASVASFYKDQLLIGTPESKLLYCEVRAY